MSFTPVRSGCRLPPTSSSSDRGGRDWCDGAALTSQVIAGRHRPRDDDAMNPIDSRRVADSSALPPILLIHGTFGRPGLFGPWLRYLEHAGFECHVPTLPGRDPTDNAVLRRTGLQESFEAVLHARNRLDAPPVLVGHSMGGLLAQKLAAVSETAGLVLLASIPPGILWTQPRAVPHLLPLLPGILAGRPIFPSEKTMRAIPLSTLTASEQDQLIPQLVPDSGRAFRAMSFGTRPTRVKRGAVRCPVLCVSGTSDLNVSNRTARMIARRYKAEHHVHAGAPHWIIAESLLDDVAPRVLYWIHNEVVSTSTTQTHRTQAPPRSAGQPVSSGDTLSP
jgi:pimeloyl-ACP methyl ester carboxylesterase